MIQEKTALNLDYDTLVLKAVDNLLDYAVNIGAENIFIEEDDEGVLVNFNSDDNILEKFYLSEKIKNEVIKRIKELAGIFSAENNNSQSGKFKKNILNRRIVFSVFLKPEKGSERVFVDIETEKTKIFDLKQLGFQKDILEKVKRNLAKKHGGAIVIGDFDSGRTATLYSFLNFLNKPELCISTVEKEPSADLPFINQSLLNGKKGFDYSLAVSEVLRQDPDIIMIDEISDRAVMEKFLNIAERGHLVLAGAYSRNIFNYFNFLFDLGVSLPFFADNVNMIVNQRLAKKNCPNCARKTIISKETMAEFKNFFDFKDLKKRIGEKNSAFNLKSSLEDMEFYKSRGCEKCGYGKSVGKIGIFEVLEMTSDVRKSIRGGHLSKIKQALREQGGFSLSEDAFLKAVAGTISLDEALKIVRGA